MLTTRDAACNVSAVKGCQRDGCRSKVSPSMNLLNAPAVLAFGMSWTSGSPSVDTIKSVLRGLQPELRVEEVFTCQASKPYTLLSLVCYYGKHYACFVHDDKTGMWTYFDDSIVREVGNTWADVLTKCESGRWQPQLLVYHRPGGSGHAYSGGGGGSAVAAPVAAAASALSPPRRGTGTAGITTTHIPHTPTSWNPRMSRTDAGLATAAAATSGGAPAHSYAATSQTHPSHHDICAL